MKINYTILCYLWFYSMPLTMSVSIIKAALCQMASRRFLVESLIRSKTWTSRTNYMFRRILFRCIVIDIEIAYHFSYHCSMSFLSLHISLSVCYRYHCINSRLMNACVSRFYAALSMCSGDRREQFNSMRCQLDELTKTVCIFHLYKAEL